MLSGMNWQRKCPNLKDVAVSRPDASTQRLVTPSPAAKIPKRRGTQRQVIMDADLELCTRHHVRRSSGSRYNAAMPMGNLNLSYCLVKSKS